MPSHALLIRAGYIRQLTAGVYEYLPLGWRVLKKLCAIIREEMDAAGGSELLLPALQPMDLFKKSGRAEAYGDDLFTLEDRHDRATALGPTHEEVITDMLRGELTSYKQLPLTLYQIQSKFRDEPRPRAGLLRGREFIMKDAYSFHVRVEGEGGLNETYDRLYEAYSNIFTRCGLDFTVVDAEAGPIGGSASHEFMVNCDNGEDTILRCHVTGYAANVEKCEIGFRLWSFGDGAEGAGGEPTRHHTPNMPGIEGVAQHLGTTPAGMLKTIVFEVAGAEDGDGLRWVLAVVRGDHEVNEGKLRDAVAKETGGRKLAMADDKRAHAAGFAIGYVSPRAILGIDPEHGGMMMLIDPDAATAGEWATGADEADHHVTGFRWRREMGDVLEDPRRVRVLDIRNARAGDPSPGTGGPVLSEQRGIEVGHIFKLGDKYSSVLGLEVMDEAQKRAPVIMGCYGIGVSRTMAACVEMSHDDSGIVWPAPLAPYHVEIIVMKPGDERQDTLARELADELSARGLDVLIDDRAERPGVKFKDADLVGIPVRLTLGDKALDAGGVEFKRRADEGKGEVAPTAEVVARCMEAIGAIGSSA